MRFSVHFCKNGLIIGCGSISSRHLKHDGNLLLNAMNESTYLCRNLLPVQRLDEGFVPIYRKIEGMRICVSPNKVAGGRESSSSPSYTETIL